MVSTLAWCIVQLVHVQSHQAIVANGSSRKPSPFEFSSTPGRYNYSAAGAAALVVSCVWMDGTAAAAAAAPHV